MKDIHQHANYTERIPRADLGLPYCLSVSLQGLETPRALATGAQPAGVLFTQVRAERDELAAEVAMLKQMVKTTSLAVSFKRSQHTSAETSLRSSRAGSPTPSS